MSQNKSRGESGRHHDQMTLLITVMNKLQDVFKATGNNNLDLPEIAVVGVESSGKSSVLESFVRKNFLPRGEGIVTRCPIILRLIYTPRSEAGENREHTEWCEFGHKPDKKWTDFSKVTEEILSRTRELTGGNKGITETPITLTVYSPNVVTLTVVDLPGIVRNARDGQPEDIEEQILKLINSYISKPTTIILAVSSATNEISTSDSIKMARLVDPTGERTLAVITKLDREDGKTLGDVLAGNVLKLKHGFIGVINQSQEDVEKGITMDQVRENEENHLKKRFPNIASQNGCRFLAQRLSRLLMAHILKQLPGLENKINEYMKTNEDILVELGSDDIPHKATTMSKTLLVFAKKFASEFEGNRRNIDTAVLTAGARVKMILDEHFVANLESVDAIGSITDDQVAIAILNSGAMESRLTICEAAYQDLVKTQIKRLLGPCLTCVNSVHEEMQGAVQNCLDPHITFQFPRLSESIVGVVTKFLSVRLAEVIKCLEKQVDIESAFVKTSRADFQEEMYKLMKTPDITEQNFAKRIVQKIGNHTWVEKVRTFGYKHPDVANSGIKDEDEYEEFEEASDSGIETPEAGTQTPPSGGATGAPGTATPVPDPTATPAETANGAVGGISADANVNKKRRSARDQTNIYIVKELIRMYFEIIRQSLKDFIPKLLAHDMIYFSSDNLAVFLNDQLHKADKIDDLIQVSADARAKRDEARRELEKLQVATKIIAEVREKVDF